MDPARAGIGNVDPAGVRNGCVHRALETLIKHRDHHRLARVDHLDAGISGIGDIKKALVIGSDRYRRIELTGAGSGASEAFERREISIAGTLATENVAFGVGLVLCAVG